MKNKIRELPAMIAAKVMAYKEGIYIPKDLRKKIEISINYKNGVITIRKKKKNKRHRKT